MSQVKMLISFVKYTPDRMAEQRDSKLLAEQTQVDSCSFLVLIRYVTMVKMFLWCA